MWDTYVKILIENRHGREKCTMMKIREKIYRIIETAEGDNLPSKVYDSFMMITIFVSLIPLAFKGSNVVFRHISVITAGVFIVDYILRLLTADYKMQKKAVSFLLYPFTPMAIIDLVSILPSLMIISGSFKLFRLFRLVRTFRVFRVFKTVRYSKNIAIIMNVFRKNKDAFMVVSWLAVGYVLTVALLIFNLEPQTFDTFFDAVYWAVISLTTMGYGDIYPVTTVGRIITILSAFVGVAIVALPAGIITAGYMEELKNMTEE